VKKLRIFVSSVQRELENERLTVLSLVTTDSFLMAHCEAVLYEFAPASPAVSTRECLDLLDACDACLSIVGREYGHTVGDASITHLEYRRAKERSLPVLAFIKGAGDAERDTGTRSWLSEIRADNIKYKRFGNILELQREVRASLLKLLRERFGVSPSSEQETISEQTIDATSPFESQPLKRLKVQNLDMALARRMTARADSRTEPGLSDADVLESMLIRGLIWFDSDSREYFGTAAGIVLLGKDPSAVFPQCRFLCDAYRSNLPDGDPSDQEDVRGPVPIAIDRVISFVDRNTRHPIRIVGLERVRLDEYPSEALREALVNAVAHRNYEDAGRKIMVEVFSDRVVVSSPGLPPKPLTIQKLRSGRYKPCSRNPVLAQALSHFHRIEERGSGMRRMHDQMISHGLGAPILTEDTGYLQVVFTGPGNDIKRLKIPRTTSAQSSLGEAASTLNPRQKKMAKLLVRGEELTSRRCQELYGVSRDTANGDFDLLATLGIAQRKGAGRSTIYVYGTKR
jgi:predicted HTH transcriptional regulator